MKRKKREKKYSNACQDFQFNGNGYDACVRCGARYGNPGADVCGSRTP